MVPRPGNGLSLCAGGGGLDMGLMLAEPGFHTRCFVEWGQYPRDVLIAAQRAGYFARAPIWDDVTTFSGKPFRGAFDTILAGYPCQPFSQAGQRKGSDDERHLWPDVARIIGEVEPTWVFLENVAGHVSLGAETVLRDLWGLGYTPAAGLFSATETGATHERLRWFCVAYRDDRGGAAQSQWGQRDERRRALDGSEAMAYADGRDASAEWQQRGRQQRLHPQSGGSGAGDVGNAPRLGCGEGRAEPELRGGRDTASGSGGTMAYADGRNPGAERQQRSGEQRFQPEGGYSGAERAGVGLAYTGQPGLEGRERGGPSDKRHGSAASGPAAELRRPLLHAPGPADMDLWRFTLDLAPDLAPALSLGHVVGVADRAAQMVAQGIMAEEAAESLVRRMADGLAARSRALRLLGNGVFPLAAAHAWRSLAAAHGLGPVDMDAADRGGNPATVDAHIRAAE